jgi:hypothetical protein
MKPRIFCLGDSFVDWDIPKFHWTYYLTHHYEVIKLGKRGADNNSIIFQLGLLDEYRDGDRILVYFTDAGRLPRRYYGERSNLFTDKSVNDPIFYKDSKFAMKLDHLTIDEGDAWINGGRENEIKFIKNLQKWLGDYRPLYITWSELFHQPTSDFVTLINVTSNADEKNGEVLDFHPGPLGCYGIYKKLHSLLQISEPIVGFEEEKKTKVML